MKWVAFLCLLITSPFSTTLNYSDGAPANLNLPVTISYKIEVWLFLILFSILIVVIYMKKLGSSSVSAKNKPVGSSGRSIYVSDEFDKPISEVPMEIPTKVDFSHDNIKGDVKSEKIKTKVSSSDLAKKLKELKK